MHIHGHPMSVNPADFYAAGQGQRTVETQKAAEIRKKLLKSASQLDGAASPEETLMINRWLDGRDGQRQGEDEYHPTGRDAEFD